MDASETFCPPEPSSLPPPPPDAYARLRMAMAKEPPPPPPVPMRRTLLTLAAITIAVLAVDALTRHRTFLRVDAATASNVCAPSAIGAAAIALLTTLIAMSGGRNGLGERVGVLRWTAISVVPLSLIPMAFLVRFHGSEAQHDVHPWGLPCIAMASVIAGLSLWLLSKRLKGSVPVAAGWRSAALGAAASAWSGFGLLVHCPSTDMAHLLIGHLFPIAVFPLVGFLFARRRVQL